MHDNQYLSASVLPAATGNIITSDWSARVREGPQVESDDRRRGTNTLPKSLKGLAIGGRLFFVVDLMGRPRGEEFVPISK